MISARDIIGQAIGDNSVELKHYESHATRTFRPNTQYNKLRNETIRDNTTLWKLLQT